MPEKQDFNMMTILKGAIGKELSKITMPVHFNEVKAFLKNICIRLVYNSFTATQFFTTHG